MKPLFLLPFTELLGAVRFALHDFIDPEKMISLLVWPFEAKQTKSNQGPLGINVR